jgi:hypothetical protein
VPVLRIASIGSLGKYVMKEENAELKDRSATVLTFVFTLLPYD